MEGVEGLTAVEGIGEGATEREGVMSLRVKSLNYGKKRGGGLGRGLEELALPTKDLCLLLGPSERYLFIPF